jgi:tetratricopeptide (TPR) repeat protein
VKNHMDAVPRATQNADDIKALFELARKDYDAGDLLGALDKLERCYSATGSPNLAYDIAVLYRDLTDYPKALEYFQKYAQDAPNGERHAEAGKEVARLSEQCPPKISTQKVLVDGATSSPVGPTNAPATQSPAPKLVDKSGASVSWPDLGWIAIGAGTLAGATAVYFTAAAIEANDHTKTRPISAAYYNENASALTRDSAYAWVFGVTSLVALGVGTFTLLASPRKPRSTAAVPTITFSRGSALAAYQVRF